ncbi:DeoR family transcriptional regulator [Enterococcus alcedinis]
MLAADRREEILKKLAIEGSVIVSKLTREFDVSIETIRRDLETLEKKGY